MSQETKQELIRIRDVFNRDINVVIKSFDPPPPPEPILKPIYLDLKPQIKLMDADFLGIFLDFLNSAWEFKDQAEAEKRIVDVLIEIRRHRFYRLSFFMWVCDGKGEHAHLNWKTPYVWEKPLVGKRKFYLDEWEGRYWELFERFIWLMRLVRDKNNRHSWLHPAPQVNMDRYDYYPFEHNHNGVKRFWTKEALPFQMALAIKALEIVKKVYGKNYQPYWKPINEPIHGGDHDKGHIIAEWHRDMWFAVKELSDLRHLIIDKSHSEYALAQLVRHSGDGNCHHCGKPWDNKKEYDRLLIPEEHGVSILENLKERNFPAFLGSAWWRSKWSEDCGGGPNAKGPVFIGDPQYRVGNAVQVKEMLLNAWSRCKRHSRRKEFIWGCFPMGGGFKKVNGRVIEYYHKDLIVWSRPKAAIEAYEEVHTG